ncbi:MAG: hypothetical protein PIR02_16060 [Microbacterium enclense]
MTTDTTTHEGMPAKMLAGIRGNVYRLAVTTRVEYDRDAPATAPRTAAATLRHAKPVKAIAYAAPLLTQLRDAIRPNQGRTDSGRGGGKTALPYDDTASALLDSIEADIAGMYRSALEMEPIGASEQLLLEWFREFEYAYRAGEVVDAQLSNLLIRIRGWRFAIEDHFTPPRKQEFAYCPSCHHTHYETFLHGEITRQRCVTVTYYPGNARRPPVAECGHCGTRWTGTAELTDLAAGVDALLKTNPEALDEPITAPIPDDTALEPDEPTTEGPAA